MLKQAQHAHGRVICLVCGFVFSIRVALTFLFFQSNPQAGTAVTLALSLVLSTAAVFLTLTFPLAGRCWSRPALSTQRWVLCYLGLSAVSLLWTTTKSVPVALGYLLGTAADVFTAWLLFREDAEERATSIMRGFVTGASIVAAIAWCIPVTEELRLGNDDFLHPNAIGFVFAIAVLLAMFLSASSRAWTWVAIALGATLLRTLSKASIIAFIAAALYYILWGARISRSAKVKIAVVANLILLTFWGVLESYLDFYTEGSRAETLTGRTYIWAQALDIAMDKPWFGHGFYSFRWVFPQFRFDFEAWHAHNELLQQFFSFGVVGVLVVVALYWALGRQVRASSDGRLKALAIAMLIFALVRGLVDTERFDLSFPLWAIVMFSAALPRRELTDPAHA
jgi:exopolysaccharide production protein ExoQ